MKTIVLIGCGKEKLPHRAKAKDLYTGTLFKKSRAYAEKFGDDWGILSAKHGVLYPDEMVEPYDLALQDLDREKLEDWIRETNGDLRRRWPGEFFVCLAGELYGRAFQRPVNLQAEFPLAGLGLGERLQALNVALRSKTEIP